MSRMFNLVTKTWNPITGCKHFCVYCWSRLLVERRLRKTTRKYRVGFRPKLHLNEFSKKFKKGEFVFVSDMGDMWGDFISSEWIEKVLEHIRRFPNAKFLFLTKNPERYLEFEDELSRMDNVILGATVETDDDALYVEHKISRAPLPSRRLRSMELVAQKIGGELMLSIEPVLDFTPFFHVKILEIAEKAGDFFMYIGYDNYNNKLPEPPLRKTYSLIKTLREHGIPVYEKTLRRAWYEQHKKP